jgi:hypothetical protein
MRAVKRFAFKAFGVWCFELGGARPPKVRNLSKVHVVFRTQVIRYLVAPTEPWLLRAPVHSSVVDTRDQRLGG